MKGYIILLVLISHFSYAQIWTDTIPGWDHSNIANIKIEYSGDWVHMQPDGSYPDGENCTATYKFWGQGIDIYTEEKNHDYYTVTLDGITDTVKLHGENIDNSLTYSRRNLSYSNHTVILSGPRYGFVLNYLVKFVDSSPYPSDSIPPLEPCKPDTIYITNTVEIIKWDTVRITDTLYLPSEIIYKLLVPKVEYDTLPFN